MYDARFIANQIMVEHSSTRFGINLRKINYLLYIVEGFHSAAFGSGIIKNNIEAFSAGPGIRVICDQFISYVDVPIEGLATYFDFELMANKIADPVCINKESRDFVSEVVSTWVDRDCNDIRSVVCAEGGPWWVTFNRLNRSPLLPRRIPSMTIRDFFVHKFIEPVRHYHVH